MRVWLAYMAILAVALLDLAVPNLVVLPFIWVPVMAAATFGQPRLTAGLATWAGLCAVTVGWATGLFGDGSYWVRLAAMAIISVIAVLLSARLGKDRRELQELSLRDPLTGLPNRRLLLEHLSAQLDLRDSTTLTVLYIDLDRFKEVNTEHGHGGGDEVLRQAAARFSSQLRHGDVLARIGGDEFAVVCSGSGGTRHSAERLCARLIASLRDPFAAAPGVDVGATIGGVVCEPASDRSATEVLAQADDVLMTLKEVEPGGYEVQLCDR